MVRTFDPAGLFDAGELGFTQARVDNGVLFVSGQVGVDEEFHVAGDDIESQTRRAFENLGLVLDAAGEDFASVGKVTTYVVDLAENVDGYRTPWREAFDEPYPCHTLIDVDQLSPVADGELLVEIDAEVSLGE